MIQSDQQFIDQRLPSLDFQRHRAVVLIAHLAGEFQRKREIFCLVPESYALYSPVKHNMLSYI